MTGYEMLWPMAAHALLVFLLYLLSGLAHLAALRDGLVDLDSLRREAQPQRLRRIESALASQFRLPVLFHIAAITLYLVQADNLPAVVLGWIFVVCRYVEAILEMMDSGMRRRLVLFVISLLAVLGLWIWLGIWMAFS